MSNYVNKVKHLVEIAAREKQAAQEWKLVAENRLDILRSVMEEMQSQVDLLSPKLLSLGIEPQSPTGMAFMNQHLESGGEIYTTIKVLVSTLFPGLKEALESAEVLINCVDESEQIVTSESTTSRPQFDLTVLDATADNIEEVSMLERTLKRYETSKSHAHKRNSSSESTRVESQPRTEDLDEHSSEGEDEDEEDEDEEESPEMRVALRPKVPNKTSLLSSF